MVNNIDRIAAWVHAKCGTTTSTLTSADALKRAIENDLNENVELADVLAGVSALNRFTKRKHHNGTVSYKCAIISPRHRGA